MSASLTNGKTKASINRVFTDIKNTKTSKSRPTSKADEVKKVAKTDKKYFFCTNYGKISVISFAH